MQGSVRPRHPQHAQVCLDTHRPPSRRSPAYCSRHTHGQPPAEQHLALLPDQRLDVSPRCQQPPCRVSAACFGHHERQDHNRQPRLSNAHPHGRGPAMHAHHACGPLQPADHRRPSGALPASQVAPGTVPAPRAREAVGVEPPDCRGPRAPAHGFPPPGNRTVAQAPSVPLPEARVPQRHVCWGAGAGEGCGRGGSARSATRCRPTAGLLTLG